jgi:hypothetical protein
MRVWLRSLLTALFAIGFASIAQADKRVALIVGNGDYRGAALGNPTFDADPSPPVSRASVSSSKC